MTPAQQFFYEHAGWGYNPAIETEEQGRRRDGDPWHDPYRRVVEAELAHQHIEEEEIAA